MVKTKRNTIHRNRRHTRKRNNKITHKKHKHMIKRKSRNKQRGGVPVVPEIIAIGAGVLAAGLAVTMLMRNKKNKVSPLTNFVPNINITTTSSNVDYSFKFDPEKGVVVNGDPQDMIPFVPYDDLKRDISSEHRLELYSYNGKRLEERDMRVPIPNDNNYEKAKLESNQQRKIIENRLVESRFTYILLSSIDMKSSERNIGTDFVNNIHNIITVIDGKSDELYHQNGAGFERIHKTNRYVMGQLNMYIYQIMYGYSLCYQYLNVINKNGFDVKNARLKFLHFTLKDIFKMRNDDLEVYIKGIDGGGFDGIDNREAINNDIRNFMEKNGETLLEGEKKEINSWNIESFNNKILPIILDKYSIKTIVKREIDRIGRDHAENPIDYDNYGLKEDFEEKDFEDDTVIKSKLDAISKFSEEKVVELTIRTTKSIEYQEKITNSIEIVNTSGKRENKMLLKALSILERIELNRYHIMSVIKNYITVLFKVKMSWDKIGESCADEINHIRDVANKIKSESSETLNGDKLKEKVKKYITNEFMSMVFPGLSIEIISDLKPLTNYEKADEFYPNRLYDGILMQ
jgi:hypothetical protein